MSALYAIKCDGCGTESPHPSPTGLRDTRRGNAKRGWTWAGGGKDYCELCSKALADARAERRKNDTTPDYL